MTHKILLSVIFMLVLAGLVSARGGGAAPAAAAYSPEMRAYAAELGSAFPGQVDIYLVGREFVYVQPPLSDVHIAGCSKVAGVLYYVVQMSNKSDMFIPQTQILAIHNHK